MPIEIADVDEGRGNIIKAWGVVTGREAVEAFTKHAEQDSEKFSKYKYSLADYTEVTRLYITLKELREIHKKIKEMTKINQEAIVASVMRNAVIYRATRILEKTNVMKAWKHTSFRSVEEAKKWIEQEVKSRHGISNIKWKGIDKRPNKAL
jgi:hypothetical protein